LLYFTIGFLTAPAFLFLPYRPAASATRMPAAFFSGSNVTRTRLC